MTTPVPAPGAVLSRSSQDSMTANARMTPSLSPGGGTGLSTVASVSPTLDYNSSEASYAVTTMTTTVTSVNRGGQATLLSENATIATTTTTTAATRRWEATFTLPPPNVTLPGHSSRPALVSDHDHYLMHGVVFQTALAVCFVAVLMGVLYILRKKHLDRLRHHLMPVYNFDPSDDGEDWETELLDDHFSHSPSADAVQSLAGGQLKLDTGLTRGLRIQNNNAGSSSGPLKAVGPGSASPTAMSGLLSSSHDSGPNSRRLYTSERDPLA